MADWLERTRLLLPEASMDRLQNAHVAVFGIGGVGSACVEALARGGIGSITLVDNDTISLSNLNRQLVATRDGIGKYKTDVMKQRILSICPEIKVYCYHTFYLPGMEDSEENHGLLPLQQYSYVVDAIDTVSAKIDLAVQSQAQGFRLISSMGTGNKLHPELFRVTDIYKTNVCPLAKVMRKELRERGVKKLKVVYSEETPRKPSVTIQEGSRRAIPGSVSFVPPVAGMIMAGEVLREISMDAEEK